MAVDFSRIGSRLDFLYLITREFSSAPDVDQALYGVLPGIAASVQAADASLFLLDPQGRIENGLLMRNHEIQQRDSQLFEIIPEDSLLGWVQKNKKGTIIKETGSDERWDHTPYNTPPLDARSAVCVPVQLPDRLLGILTITSPQPDHFDESDLAMLTIIADQAAFALDNARLIKAEQHRRRVADTLASIAHNINATLNLNEVLNLILKELALVVDYDSSSILLYDDDKTMLSVQAARGFEDIEDALSFKLPFNENSPNYQAILQQEPTVISDVDQVPLWVKTASSQHVKSWIGAPLIARGEPVGILAVDSREVNK